jgi:hypothetical protein
MKRFFILLLLAATLFISLSCGTRSVVRTRPYPPQSGLTIDVSFFYDELAPYGRWFQVDGYGWVWTPYDVPFGWRPYTHGHWVYTDYGWTWVSRWRWGWAPFHYGRWVSHARHGWVWLPGNVWGPAWVVWRRGSGWLGWAAMPPQSGWRVGLRFDLVFEADRLVEPHWYNFVPDRHFADRDWQRRQELPARNVTLIRETQNITNYTMRENRAVNRSLTTEPIEQATRRTVPQHRVVDSRAGNQAEQVRGNDVMVYRPNVTPNPPPRPPRNVEPRTQRPSTSAEIERREANERRQLEDYQTRSRQTLERQQQEEQRRATTARDEIQRRQEAERRAQQDQTRREQEVLRSRQETKRQAEPPPRDTKSTRPQTERKTPPRKPGEKPM